MSGSPVWVDGAGSESCPGERSAVIQGDANVWVGSPAANLGAFDVFAGHEVDLEHANSGI